MNYDLNKFDHISIDPSSTMLIVGSRRSGKTTYAKYLVSQINKFYNYIIVFTKY